MRGFGRLLPAAIVGVVLAVVLGVTVVAAAPADECATAGASLGEARSAYAANCSLPRVDCDPVGGTWYCSSRVIGSKAPKGVTGKDVGESAIGSDPDATSPSNSAVTEPPSSPTTGLPASTTTVAPPTSAKPTTTTAAPVPACDVVIIEAEDIPLVGDWQVKNDRAASGGQYIVWEGGSGPDYWAKGGARPDPITVPVVIGRPGTYEFTWAMRQDARRSRNDLANDSYLDFPDASRFGNSQGDTFDHPVKVYGRATGGSFVYSATSDDHTHGRHAVEIDFDTAGTYTLWIAGRSHGHQLDRIVIHHESVSRNDAIAGRGATCGSTAPTPATAPAPVTTAPEPTVPPSNPASCTANTSGTADLRTDLIALHYDNAPDPDDGQATVAGKEVADDLGFRPLVVNGAYGTRGDEYEAQSEAVMDLTWGRGGWLDAHGDWDGAVDDAAEAWVRTLNACGDVWVAEGGPSDFTADVVREVTKRLPTLDADARIHVVQHSDWNERHTTSGDLPYVQRTVDYVRIEDGNRRNATAALAYHSDYNGSFRAISLAGENGAAWAEAYAYYNVNSSRKKLDFSDTVELLHIVGIGKDKVADYDDFAQYFIA